MKRRIEPGPGQESVWDYPRPPALEPLAASVKVVFDGVVVAASTSAYRVLETSHPPTIYIPPKDVDASLLEASDHTTFCEFKGQGRYWHLRTSKRFSANAGWFYDAPTPRFSAIEDYISFYPSRVDACFLDEEQVQAQEGDFYGGWITSQIVGPFKGGPGTWGW